LYAISRYPVLSLNCHLYYSIPIFIQGIAYIDMKISIFRLPWACWMGIPKDFVFLICCYCLGIPRRAREALHKNQLWIPWGSPIY